MHVNQFQESIFFKLSIIVCAGIVRQLPIIIGAETFRDVSFRNTVQFGIFWLHFNVNNLLFVMCKKLHAVVKSVDLILAFDFDFSFGIWRGLISESILGKVMGFLMNTNSFSWVKGTLMKIFSLILVGTVEYPSLDSRILAAQVVSIRYILS